MPNPPSGPRAKIDRAKRHFGDLEAAVAAYIRSGDCSAEVEEIRRTQGRLMQVFYRAAIKAPIPDEVSCLIGDCVHNLRAALDILGCELVRHNGNVVTEQHGFPIVDDASKFKSELGRKLNGADKSACRAIAALKPYKGGADDFWLIHQLDILDKHRLLLTANSTLEVLAVPERPPDTDRFIPIYRKGPRKCLKHGDPLFMMGMPPESLGKLEFLFEVALNQPGLVQCEPVLPLLRRLIEFVERTVYSFDTFFV